jgi:hypothetical protein
MLVVYVGPNEHECAEVNERLTGTKARLELGWARRAADLMTFDGPERAVVILGSDLGPFERLRLLGWLGLYKHSLTAIALGEPVRGVATLPIESLTPRALIERARPVTPPRLAA